MNVERLSIKILKKFLLLSVVVFVVVGTLSYFWIKELYIDQVKKELEHTAELIALELPKEEDYERFVQNIKRLTGVRVTLIDKDGNVIAESDVDPNGMDNHKNRPEIFAASYKRYGVAIRESKTLHKELLYVAKKVMLKHKEHFLRVATSFEAVYDNFLSFAWKVSLIFLIFLGGLLYVVYKISDEVRFETDRIISFLKELKEQTTAHEIRSDYSEEFSELTKYLSEVSAALAKKSRKKAKYTAKLKLANRQKDEILSAVSHEFKNPISVISGYSQTLIEDPQINPRIRDRFLNKIHTSAQKLSAMIDRPRLFIKLEEDSQPVKRGKVDLEQMLQEIKEELLSAYSGREIILETLPCIKEVDAPVFRVAVENLVENALKYSEEEVVVKLDCKRLEVIDRGIGIEKKEIKKITNKFYRVSTNGWNNSLGIGLSLVEHIVRVHGFSLVIESKKGEGSKFSIVFESV